MQDIKEEITPAPTLDASVENVAHKLEGEATEEALGLINGNPEFTAADKKQIEEAGRDLAQQVRTEGTRAALETAQRKEHEEQSKVVVVPGRQRVQGPTDEAA
jgi:hypothetical protein